MKYSGTEMRDFIRFLESSMVSQNIEKYESMLMFSENYGLTCLSFSVLKFSQTILPLVVGKRVFQ